MPPSTPLPIAVLISGGGTTLRNFIQRIAAGSLPARIELVISSNPNAKGLEFAAAAGIESRVIERGDYRATAEFSDAVFAACRQRKVELACMGGFLKHVDIPDDFAIRVMNIHPALIPAFCGKGYYGLRVHQAVLQYGAKVSGCTVHFVDQRYDHGPVILQHAVPVLDDDTPESLAARVFAEECEAYPEAVRLFAEGRLTVRGRRVLVSR